MNNKIRIENKNECKRKEMLQNITIGKDRKKRKNKQEEKDEQFNST